MAVSDFPEPKEYFAELKQLLARAGKDKADYQAIVDAPFYNKQVATMFGLGIVVLLLVNEKDMTIDRVAQSRTEMTEGATRSSTKPFTEIKIPVDNAENYIVQAVRDHQPNVTTDWYYLLTPGLSGEEARFDQAGGGIACSIVYPLEPKGRGALVFSYFELLKNIEPAHHDFMKKYSQLVSQVLPKDD